MKRAILKTLAALAMAGIGLLGLLTFSHLTASATEQNPGWTQETSEHMNEMRGIMHSAQFNAQATNEGIQVTVTGKEQKLVAAIQEEFGGQRHALKSSTPEVTITSAAVNNGVVLTFSSANPKVVEALKAGGAGYAYQLLRDNMHELMTVAAGTEGSAPCAGFGPGMMGPGAGRMGWGQGPGAGYGPGMMGSGAGYGPGMMGSGAGYGPGMMGSGWGHMGGWSRGTESYGP
jgi:hypothetical protein